MAVVRGRLRACRGFRMTRFSTPRIAASIRVETADAAPSHTELVMKKIVPDPPEDLHAKFELPPGQSLSAAIFQGLVPIEEVLMNLIHYLLFSYNDCFHAYQASADDEVKRLLVVCMQNMEIALGQGDAVVGALKQRPESGFHEVS